LRREVGFLPDVAANLVDLARDSAAHGVLRWVDEARSGL
jgi:hypothetical protein